MQELRLRLAEPVHGDERMKFLSTFRYRMGPYGPHGVYTGQPVVPEHAKRHFSVFNAHLEGEEDA